MRYDGHAFNEGLPRGRASGQLEVTPHEVVFTTMDGQHQARLPIARLELKLGGASNRLLFFSHPDHPGWTFYTSDLSVLGCPSLSQHDHLRRQLRAARRLRIWGWSLLGGVAALVVAVPLLVTLNMDLLSGWLAPSIPVAWEKQIGESAISEYRAGQRFYEDEALSAAMDDMMAPLLGELDSQRYRDFHVYVSRDDAINAMALPGGYIIVNQGLLEKAGGSEEVLGVLAHEIAHVTEQHGIRNLINTVGVLVVIQALFGDVEGLAGTLVGAAPFLLRQSYSRDFEREADSEGLALLREANIDPRGMVAFFRRLHEKEQQRMEALDEEQRAWAEQAQALLSTHPATDERIATLEQAIREAPEAGYRDVGSAFARVRDRLNELENKEDQGREE